MKKLLLYFLFCALFSSSKAQQKPEQYNLAVNYLLYLPQDYVKDTTRRWPLLIFLHGSGERGDDLEKVKVHGPAKLIEQGKQFPFIVVSPQASINEGWEPEILIRFIRDLQTKYKVDKERIYLTGLSMGGYGTWRTAMKFPFVFAAIAPICGGGDTTGIGKLRHVPVWCFHGAKDKVVLPWESLRMVNALKKYNPDVRLTMYPDAGHDSWTAAYNNDSLYEWFLQHKRFRYQPKLLSDAELADYTGGYAEPGKDTLHIVANNGKLRISEEAGIDIISFDRDKFFFTMNDREIEIQFARNRKGKVERLVVYDEQLLEFIKVN